MESSPPTDAIAKAVSATAEAITGFGGELNGHFRESDLQKILEVALGACVADAHLGLTVRPNLGVKFDEWPGVGPIDLSLLDGNVPAAFLELKWGANTLYNCVWDLPKMAVAVALARPHAPLARPHVPHAYLVAGAPAHEWKSGDGSELFADGETSVADLIARYRKHWDFWKRDVKTHPLSLPAQIQSRQVTTKAMTVRDRKTGQDLEWSLRCVEISGTGNDWHPICEPR